MVVCREESYANAALELRTTRANIKRVCEEFAKAVGRPLFEETSSRSLSPTPFAHALVMQVVPLSRGLRRLDETVRTLHESGRILRFAAAGEFFKGGLFTDFLGRLKISEAFRPCFLRIETKRFRNALLNAECDVYFGIGLTATDRLDLVHLGTVPWKINAGPKYKGKLPTKPGDLNEGKWFIGTTGDADADATMLKSMHAAKAKDGRVLSEDSPRQPKDDEILLTPDTTLIQVNPGWPCYHFSAVLRKHHPYSELLPRLMAVALD